MHQATRRRCIESSLSTPHFRPDLRQSADLGNGTSGDHQAGAASLPLTVCGSAVIQADAVQADAHDHTDHTSCSANLDRRTMGRPDLLLVVLLALTVPGCGFTKSAPLITPDSEITWNRPSLDERIGWKLCVDQHPCVDLGPISARSSNDTTQTYQSHFWSQSVAPYLTPGTHTLAVVVYKLHNRTLESRRSAAMRVRVGEHR
jgi:hypothetical protein